MCSWGCELVKRKVELISVCYQSWVEVTSPNFSTRPCVKVKSDNLPLLLVTWIDLVTSSIALEKPSKFFSLPWKNNRSVFGIASLPNNDQVLWEASELAIVKHGYLFCETSFGQIFKRY